MRARSRIYTSSATTLISRLLLHIPLQNTSPSLSSHIFIPISYKNSTTVKFRRNSGILSHLCNPFYITAINTLISDLISACLCWRAISSCLNPRRLFMRNTFKLIAFGTPHDRDSCFNDHYIAKIALVLHGLHKLDYTIPVCPTVQFLGYR